MSRRAGVPTFSANGCGKVAGWGSLALSSGRSEFTGIPMRSGRAAGGDGAGHEHERKCLRILCTPPTSGRDLPAARTPTTNARLNALFCVPHWGSAASGRAIRR